MDVIEIQYDIQPQCIIFYPKAIKNEINQIKELFTFKNVIITDMLLSEHFLIKKIWLENEKIKNYIFLTENKKIIKDIEDFDDIKYIFSKFNQWNKNLPEKLSTFIDDIETSYYKFTLTNQTNEWFLLKYSFSNNISLNFNKEKLVDNSENNYKLKLYIIGKNIEKKIPEIKTENGNNLKGEILSTNNNPDIKKIFSEILFLQEINHHPTETFYYCKLNYNDHEYSFKINKNIYSLPMNESLSVIKTREGFYNYKDNEWQIITNTDSIKDIVVTWS